MPEVLPDESDQNFLYQLICSQLENDGYMKSAECLQVELNSLEQQTAPGNKLEKLVNMCIQIKRHIDGHFSTHPRRAVEVSKVDTEMAMDADSTNKTPDPLSPGAPAPNQPDNSSPKDCAMEVKVDTVVEDATSSSEIATLKPSLDSLPFTASSTGIAAVPGSPGALDSSALKNQLLKQHVILQQIQLHQLQTSSFDEQAKRLSEYMLNCYKSDFSMVRESSSPRASPHDVLSRGDQQPLSQASPRTMSPSSGSLLTSPGSLLQPPAALGSSATQLSPGHKDLKPWNTASKITMLDKMLVSTSSKPPATQAELDRKRFPCRYCGRRFTQQSALQVHERTHTGEKPYHCHYCDKAFTQISNLKCHERLHTGEKPYRCQLCGKRFTQSASLRCHMRSHTGERPYLCKFCNKRFTQPASLQHHIRIHTGEKPYKCDHCGKCFTQPSSLVVHRRLHTGERPFACQICGKSYTQAMPLKEHMRTHHCADKSPLSFNIGQPFSLQNINQLQTSLSTNISTLPFLLNSTNFNVAELSKTAATSSTSETSIATSLPASTMSQILFNRSSSGATAFQSVFPASTSSGNDGGGSAQDSTIL